MSASFEYALGNTDFEHQRLIRQARRWRTSTERLFREAGLSEGHRVLDLGSGIGDVAMLAAQIVGPSGEVVGIERDARSAQRARFRCAEAGFSNLSIIEADIAGVEGMPPVDAVVGRFILQFLPDPVAALRHVREFVRPGGIFALQEVTWSPAQAANACLPLWSACAALARESINRTGADTDIGLSLHRIVLQAGFPEPQMQIEMKMSTERSSFLWAHDLLVSVRAGLSAERLDALGDFENACGSPRGRGSQRAMRRRFYRRGRCTVALARLRPCKSPRRLCARDRTLAGRISDAALIASL